MDDTSVIVGATLSMAAAHLISSPILAIRRRFVLRTASFVGGMAIAYLFLHLLPEVDLAHSELGSGIYVITLIGFCIFYGLEHTIAGHLRENSDNYGGPRHLQLRLTAAAVYNALIAYSLGEQLPANRVLVALYVVGLCAHLITIDNGLEETFGNRYKRLGRGVLIAANVGGAALAVATEVRELIVDVTTAALAGFMMFNVFRDELPRSEAGRRTATPASRSSPCTTNLTKTRVFRDAFNLFVVLG